MARILAVDDSPTMRGLVSNALQKAGYEVHLASDGVEGVRALAQVDPSLVITDINMPKLDGFGLIEAIRDLPDYSNIPILVLTTESSAEMKARARSAGATGWIVKPFEDDHFISIIYRVLGR